MTKLIDLNSMANTIAEIIEQGVEIKVEDEKNNVKRITVLNPANGNVALVSFKVPNVNDTPRITAQADESIMPLKATPVFKATPAAQGIKKNTSRWWSRFNFEKNIMTMCLFALQERFPGEESFPQRMFAERLASMMHWKVNTAYRHITRAAKMGIIYRAVVGTTYHITGINDTDVETAQQEVADREKEPEEMPLPFSDYYLEEGKPALEREIDKAVDETILP